MSKTSADLLPCPFCKGKAELKYEAGSWGYYPAKHWAQCLGCGAKSATIEDDEIKGCDLKNRVVEVWNCRAAHANQPAPTVDMRQPTEQQFNEFTARYAQPAPTAAPEQVAPLGGRKVSVDVSTGEHDAGNRIFAELTGETGSDGTTLLAIEQSRNFTSQPSEVAPLLYARQFDLDNIGTHGVLCFSDKDHTGAAGDWNVPLYLAAPSLPAADKCPDDLHVYSAEKGENSCLFCDTKWPNTPAPTVSAIDFDEWFNVHSDGVQLRSDKSLEDLRKLFAHQPAQEQVEFPCSVGVGSGSGNLFVHGDYDAVKATQNIILENGSLKKALRDLLTDVRAGVLDGDALRDAQALLDTDDTAAPAPVSVADNTVSGQG